jgi:hypothetical protein
LGAQRNAGADTGAAEADAACAATSNTASTAHAAAI